MTQEIKYPEELKEARFRNIQVNPHCAIVPCYHPGATLGDFCPYHQDMFRMKVEQLKRNFIRQHLSEVS